MIDRTVPWVLLRVRDQLFGVPATYIREMAEIPPVRPIPNAPDYMLGFITLRGQVTPTIDLRRRLGLRTADEDLRLLTDQLVQAVEEHQANLAALETVIRDGHGAIGEPVPGECRFGAWLRAFSGKNAIVRVHLKKLDDPHARFHMQAREVRRLAESDPVEAAAAFHRMEEREFPAFTRALAQARDRLVHAHRQIVVILTLDGRTLGASADEVESIEHLKNGSIEELPQHLPGLRTGLTRSVGRRTRDDEVVMILEVDELFNGSGMANLEPVDEPVPVCVPPFDPTQEDSMPGDLPPDEMWAMDDASPANEDESMNDTPTPVPEPSEGSPAEEPASPTPKPAHPDDYAGWCGDPLWQWRDLVPLSARGPVSARTLRASQEDENWRKAA